MHAMQSLSLTQLASSANSLHYELHMTQISPFIMWGRGKQTVATNAYSSGIFQATTTSLWGFTRAKRANSRDHEPSYRTLNITVCINYLSTAPSVTGSKPDMFVFRLPILQGGTFTLLAPSMTMLSMPEWTCPAWTQNASLVNSTSPEFTEVWQTRMRAVSVQLWVGIITKLAQKQGTDKALLMGISAYSTIKICDGKKKLDGLHL